jgi:phosphoserine phosphatase
MLLRKSSPRFLVVLDSDSTLIENEVIELLASEAGSLPEVANITEQAMRGECDFVESLRRRVSTLQGLDDGAFSRVAASITITNGAQQLISGIHKNRGVVGVVSGGFHELLDPIAENLSLDFCRANRLHVTDRRITGVIDGAIVDAQAKAETLREWAIKAGIPRERTIAVGDGANDLAMMTIAGLSIAFDAKPAVRERANICLDRRDLAQVLPLLGLPRI